MKNVVGTVAIALLGAACSDSDSTSDALGAVCESQDEVLGQLATLAALDPTVDTTDSYRAALDDLEDSVNDLRDAREDLVEEDVNNVENSFDTLRSDLEGLEDVPLSQISDEVSSAVTVNAVELVAFYGLAFDNSSCSERRNRVVPANRHHPVTSLPIGQQ